MMMSKVLASTAMAAVLLMVVGRPAFALWELMELTPRNLKSARHGISIEAKDVRALKQFTISVAPPPGSTLSTSMSAELSLNTRDTSLASVPVEGRREGEKLTYQFRVSPSTLSNSVFELSIARFPRQQGVEIPSGGVVYRVRLQHFVPVPQS